ncbi:MAG: protein-L-isoaspartate O-methyltransferase [Candidatus Thermoplasmatota archaeon]|nr:protein-L-isoaspartate O-methyltransferase [Candidatus Thermoplasmatota archaeon]
MEKELLIKKLIRNGYLLSEEVIDAMKEIPRELFVPGNEKKQAYADIPLKIGYGQTISAPHMVAIMTEALDLKKDSKVMEIGTGTGYHAAVVAKVAEEGHIYTVERIMELAEKAKRNFKKLGIKNVTVVVSDGSAGLPEYSPFDRIYVTCAAPSVPPQLVKQLSEHGKMLLPVGRTFCDLILIEKNEEMLQKNLGACSFVPMIGRKGYNG